MPPKKLKKPPKKDSSDTNLQAAELLQLATQRNNTLEKDLYYPFLLH